MSESDPSFPRAALEALNAGNKIEAIRILREATGLDLREAKEAVERRLAGQSPVLPRQPRAGDTDALPLAAVAALQSGKFVEAVRIVRETRRVGLKDAKEAVDRYIASEPLLRSRIEAGRAERRRNALLWGIALALIAGLVVYALAKT